MSDKSPDEVDYDENDLYRNTYDEETMLQLNSLIQRGKGVKNDESPAFNMRLIAEVKARPYLYDHTNEGYSIVPFRTNAWNEIASVLESTPDHCKTRWKTLRDRFKKEDKKERTTGKGTSWIFQKPLRFIQPHVKDRPEECDQSSGALEDDEEEHRTPMETALSFIKQEITQRAGAATSDDTHEQPVIPPSQKRARVSLTEGLLAPIRTPTVSMVSPLWHKPAEEEEDEMFGKIIAIRLSKMAPKTREIAKMRIMQTLFDVQFGNVVDEK